jgi:hypothetical protein
LSLNCLVEVFGHTAQIKFLQVVYKFETSAELSVLMEESQLTFSLFLFKFYQRLRFGNLTTLRSVLGRHDHIEIVKSALEFVTQILRNCCGYEFACFKFDSLAYLVGVEDASDFNMAALQKANQVRASHLQINKFA